MKSALLPRGIRNNNPGNIRTLPAGKAWRGQVGDDGGGYGVYDKMSSGVRALGKQLQVYERRGLDTVREIISTWAPASENDTRAYVSAVARELGVAPDDAINVTGRLEALAAAIIRHENGAAFTTYTDPATGARYTAGDLGRWARLP